MQNASDLKTQLQAIQRKSYPAYKSLKGSYQFRDFILHIDHVQGDPFASPSHIRIRLSHKTAGFPATYFIFQKCFYVTYCFFSHFFSIPFRLYSMSSLNFLPR